MFKIKTNMVPTVQMNFVSDEKFRRNLWTCSGCFGDSLPSLLHGHRDTQQHILSCNGYTILRVGCNLDVGEDLVEYFRDVIKLRSSMDDWLFYFRSCHLLSPSLDCSGRRQIHSVDCAHMMTMSFLDLSSNDDCLNK